MHMIICASHKCRRECVVRTCVYVHMCVYMRMCVRERKRMKINENPTRPWGGVVFELISAALQGQGRQHVGNPESVSSLVLKSAWDAGPRPQRSELGREESKLEEKVKPRFQRA